MGIRDKAQDEAKSLCSGCSSGSKMSSFYLNDKAITDVTDQPCLFSVGHSTFFRQGNCSVVVDCRTGLWEANCRLNFSIRDWFRDPLGRGIEVGGKPYQINAGWPEAFRTGGTTRLRERSGG